MADTIARALAVEHSPEEDQLEIERSASVDQWFADLRQAMTDTGWNNVDALAAEMSKNLGRPMDRSYLNKLLNQDKPWRPEYEVALPDDLEARFHDIRSERFGRTVVPPMTEAEAERYLALGLFGTLKARMAKATLARKLPMAKAGSR